MVLTVLTFGDHPPAANTYVVANATASECIVIDPGPAIAAYQHVAAEGLHCRLVINTHAHYHHTAGNLMFQTVHACPIAMHALDRDLAEAPERTVVSAFALGADSASPDLFPNDGEGLVAGDMAVKIIHTGIHTPGSMLCQLEDTDGNSFLFTGDVLFADGWDRSCCQPAAATAALLDRLLDLDPKTRVLPGHGESTTLEKLLGVLTDDAR